MNGILRWATLGLLLISLGGHCASPSAALPSEIAICDDIAEWPPYTYRVRKDGAPTGEVTGYSTEVVRTLLTRAGLKVRVQLLPWKRCEEEVRVGTRYLMLLNASRNAQRERDFWISRPLYATRNFYFWSLRQHPNGIPIREPADLKKYRVGGLLGYAYSQLQAAEPDRFFRASSHAQLVQMLHLGRIDVMVVGEEIFRGLSQLAGEHFEDDLELARAPLGGVGPNAFHLLFTRAKPAGAQLHQLIERGLDEMESRGELQQLRRQFRLTD